MVEQAPWWRGFWERLIVSVNRSLKKILQRATLSYEELITVLTEVETIINSRPITYIYEDEKSISYPLTPSHSADLWSSYYHYAKRRLFRSHQHPPVPYKKDQVPQESVAAIFKTVETRVFARSTREFYG